MNIKLLHPYKSLKKLEWNDIPKFAVITGVNGSGKSQLLELIHRHYNRAPGQGSSLIATETLDITEVVYGIYWHLSDVEKLNYVNYDNQRKELFGEFLKKDHKNPLKNLQKLIDEKHLDTLKVLDNEYDDFSIFDVLKGNSYLTKEFQNICYDYKVKFLNKIAEKLPEVTIYSLLGREPWIILNEILEKSKLKFKVNGPSLTRFDSPFHLKLTSVETETEIEFSQLSGGEQVIMSLIFLLFRKDRSTFNFPKLLLLDEPDAHLHPSMTKQFIDIIKNVFVDELGIRVIMTTHSPSTVALTPKENLFEMYKEEPRIRPSKSKNKTIHLLTQGLVLAGEGAKYFIVEDNDDKSFYTMVYNLLIDEGLISGNIPLVFIPASNKKTGDSGGVTKVTGWVDKLAESGLDNLIHGLIDFDNGSTGSKNVFKISRYCFENYLCDPIIIYSTLVEYNQLNNCFVDHTPIIKFGEQHKIKNLKGEELQSISNLIIEYTLEKERNHPSGLDLSDNSKFTITYQNGLSIICPNWLKVISGKDLINKLFIQKEVFNNKINFDNLLKEFQRVRLFPSDLVETFKTISS